MAYSLAKLDELKNDLLATRPSFEQMNMNKVDFAKEMEFAVQMFQNNDYLLKMEPATIKNCLINVALSGLTLSPVMKMAYLVPRKGKCCLDPSYMGLIKIMTDTGSVKSIKAKPVYSNEPFEIEQGTGGFVKHGICKDGKKGTRIGAYSIAVLNDGSNHIEWMYEDQLMEIKARSEGVKSGKQSPWLSDPDEMVRKTVIKRHWKFLPKSERAIMAAQAIAFDDENNGIDFDKENAQQAPSHSGATPQAPSEDAMATAEDYEVLLTLLDDEVLKGLDFFHYSPKLKPKAMKLGIQTRQKENTLEKHKAEELIEFLQEEIKWATENPKVATDKPE